MAFELPELPYPEDSLEPHIDSKTMNIHYGKHHAGYTSKLNAAIEGTPNDNKSIEDVGQEIFESIVSIASGKQSKSEAQGLGDLEFVPWQIGATM